MTRSAEPRSDTRKTIASVKVLDRLDDEVWRIGVIGFLENAAEAPKWQIVDLGLCHRSPRIAPPLDRAARDGSRGCEVGRRSPPRELERSQPSFHAVEALKPSCIGKPSLMSVSGVVLFTSRGLRVQPSNASLERLAWLTVSRQHAASADVCLVDVCPNKGTSCTRSATIRKLYWWTVLCPEPRPGLTRTTSTCSWRGRRFSRWRSLQLRVVMPGSVALQGISSNAT